VVDLGEGLLGVLVGLSWKAWLVERVEFGEDLPLRRLEKEN
jgi:hypothetical protein